MSFIPENSTTGMIARLPPELERIIFEYAAVGTGKSDITSILLVSQRVHEWIRPTLYRVLIIDAKETEEPIGTFRIPGYRAMLKDIGQFVHHILFILRNVSLERASTTVKSALEYTRNARSISIWFSVYDSPSIIGSMNVHGLRPTHLSMRLSFLDQRHFRTDVFKSLTHLDVLSAPGSEFATQENRWMYLADLPVLSHLRLSVSDYLEPDAVSTMLHPAGRFRLQILIYTPEESPDEDEDTWYYEKIDDHRLVLIAASEEDEEVEDEWASEAEGNFDCWTFSERVSEARRRKLFSVSQLRWVTRDLDWVKELNDEGRKWYLSLDWD